MTSPEVGSSSVAVGQLHDIVVAFVADLAPIGEDGAIPDIIATLSLVDDLGYHSLALLELAFSFEDELDLPPLDEEAGRGIRTVGDIEEYLANELRALGRLAE